MVRVPNAQSLAALVGEAAPLEPDASPYSELTDREFSRLMIRVRQALHSHGREAQHRDPDTAADAASAYEAARQVLQELAMVAPDRKRDMIKALLERYPAKTKP